ncbi:MAG: tetratricopeptide (TPR) repeat protein [Crocinitomicaceae bacterium]|jgi:tetratricopeptide (TPR) repeat protein
MKNTLICFFAIAFFTLNLSAQEEPEFTIAFLENDNIAEVNVDQESYIASIAEITDVSKKEFQRIESTQKIAILITSHKKGAPTIELYSNPKIGKKQKEGFLKKLKALNHVNTKLVDFPMLLLLNSKFENLQTDFNDLIAPADKRQLAYKSATLEGKFELNKAYAAEVLTVLSAFQTIVDDQFVGVKNFGELITKTDFDEKQKISPLTSENQDYWRAIMEMSVGNQLIPITNVFALVSQGEFDYATKYVEVLLMFSDPKSIANTYLEELWSRLNTFNNDVNGRIEKGFVYHDSGKYQKAIDLYNEILKEYPNSAWAKYEVYFSQNALSVELEKASLVDRTEWDKAKVGIYKSNPLYPLNVNASNSREIYLMFRRISIGELFKDRENRLSDIYEYASIAMDLEVYDFAAQLYWISITFDKTENDALFRFLYCLEKLGVTELKSNFEGDFEKEFEKIEKAQEAAIQKK